MDAAAVVPRAIHWRKSTTDIPAPGASARLYSQTNHDERGNFHYRGDLYRAGDNLATLAARIEGHLKSKFPDTRFAIKTEKFAGGRKITAEILDTPTDLTPRDAQNSFFVEVRDQMKRFGFTRSKLLQDFHTCSFYCEAHIGQAYWAAPAARRGTRNPVQAKLTLAALRSKFGLVTV